MNPGDFAVTVAIGSVTASLILQGEVSLSQGVAALASLVGLQFVTEWVTSRSQRVRVVVDGHPVLLVYRGQMRQDAMRRENIHEEDIFAAARLHGLGRL